ncbi:MAG: hypothetical protein Q7S65_00520 [Nanoarchaeota archaeon]|nr:hypothetical protein [Nanoarchaeota archaeon]
MEGETKKELGRKIALHLLLLFLVALVGYLNIQGFFADGKLPVIDTWSGYYPRAQILKESIQTYGNGFPLWQPYLMLGAPFKDAVFDLFSYLGILTLLSPDAFTAVGLFYILSYLLIGISMYLLGSYLFKDPKAAVVAGLVGMLAGYATTRLGEGANQLAGFSVLPIAFLFLVKAFKEKAWAKYAVLSGLFVAIQVKVSPDLKVTLFSTLLFGLYFLFQLIGSHLKARLVKAALIALIIGVVGFGLTAHYLLPQKALVDTSSRSALSFEESSRRQVATKDLFSTMVEPVHKDMFRVRYTEEAARGIGFKIGIFAFLLAVYALWRNPKNKLLLFLAAVSLLAVSIATASPVFYFLWKYVPPWDSFRYVNRAFVLWSFAGALLAAAGIKALGEDLREKWNCSDKKANIITWALIALIILNLVVFVKDPVAPLGPRCNIYELLPHADALNSIKAEKDATGELFRVHDIETTGIDWPTDPYTIALGLEHIFGYVGAWDVEYMNQYLSIAYRSPAKFWGILNVKYLTARSPQNLTGFRFVKQFDRFESDGQCPPPNVGTWNDPNADATMKAFGQYLYENERYLPRAYVVNHSILILGSHENVLNAVYALLLDDRIDPRTPVLIPGRPSVNDYSLEELSSYSVVFLTEGSITPQSESLLKKYAARGGSLLPDILNGQSSITEQAVAEVLEGGKEVPARVEVQKQSFEEARIVVDRQVKGFVVLSERWAMSPGWQVSRPMGRANGVVTALYLDGLATQIDAEYVPTYHRAGVAISGTTLILLAAYFSYLGWNRFRKSRPEQIEKGEPREI